MQKNLASDKDLIREYLDGNKASFEVLLKRHKQKIYSVIIYMVRDSELANDIFQETWMKVILTLNGGRYSEENKFSAWVARIAHNLVIDHFRSEKHMPKLRDKEEYSIFDLMGSKEDSGLESMVKEEQKTEVRNMIHKLPKEQREVVIMRIYGELSFKEIAEITGVSINTSLGRMRYALINLRDLMGSTAVKIKSATAL